MNSNLAYKEEPREEVINGELVAMSPSPGWNHVSVAGNIYHIFKKYLKGKKCTAIQDGFDVHLTDKDVFEPDMMVVCDRNKIRRDGIYGAPDLVIEVLSPSTSQRDREYWLVSTGEQAVEVYLLQGEELVLDQVYTIHPDWMLEGMKEEERARVATHFRCSLFDDLNIALADIFDDMLP